jgi:tetratricopeptide (TPR) repeat protein
MGYSMILKYFLAICLFWVLPRIAHAQQLPLANEAARLCRELQLDAALEKSNQSISDKTETTDAYTWYVNGFILKEIYKTREYGLRNSAYREGAIQSFAHSMGLKNAPQHLAMTRLALKYLASTYYNDALQSAQSISESGEKEANALFAAFSKWMPVAEPGISMTGYEKEFIKSIGQRYFSLWQRDTDNPENRDKAVDQYRKILELDASDVDAYYNLSVIHYNQAVFMYRKIDHTTDLFDMMTIQEGASKLIREEALPLMDKAYELAPEKGEVVKGKIILHRALDHEKDVEYFKSEIARLIREGKITADQTK